MSSANEIQAQLAALKAQREAAQAEEDRLLAELQRQACLEAEQREREEAERQRAEEERLRLEEEARLTEKIWKRWEEEEEKKQMDVMMSVECEWFPMTPWEIADITLLVAVKGAENDNREGSSDMVRQKPCWWCVKAEELCVGT